MLLTHLLDEPLHLLCRSSCFFKKRLRVVKKDHFCECYSAFKSGKRNEHYMRRGLLAMNGLALSATFKFQRPWSNAFSPFTPATKVLWNSNGGANLTKIVKVNISQLGDCNVNVIFMVVSVIWFISIHFFTNVIWWAGFSNEQKAKAFVAKVNDLPASHIKHTWEKEWHSTPLSLCASLCYAAGETFGTGPFSICRAIAIRGCEDGTNQWQNA